MRITFTCLFLAASCFAGYFTAVTPLTHQQDTEEQLSGESKLIMNLLDLNNDRRLDKSELEGNAIDMLEELDQNGDSVIDVSELAVFSEEQVDVHTMLSSIDTMTHPSRIVDLPNGIHKGINLHFKKYTNVLAPNGTPIHFLAMDGWSNDRILHARKVMEHFLTDVPGIRWGNKAELANTMANNHATMILLNDQRDMDRVLPSLENTNLQLQDLRANESPYEGESDYMGHESRDAAWEEVFHLVHAAGILEAMKSYDRDIRKFAKQARQSDLWNYDEPNMPGNHFEYIICVFDNYIDLWKTPPTHMEGHPIRRQPKGYSFGHEYKAFDRASTKEVDPNGFALVEEFNPRRIAYTAELPTEFEGEFSISTESKSRYGEKAKFIANVTARGNKKVQLIGNQYDNRLLGNSADNRFIGNGGDDSLFGGAGIDTAVFRGPRKQYTIRQLDNLVEIHDSTVNRDGYDVLSSIEWLVFSDQKVELKK